MDIVSTLKFLLTNSVYFVLPFTLCMTAILLFDKIALSMGAVDRPNERKQHLSDVPVLGGVAIYLAFAGSVSLFLPGATHLVLLVLCLALVAIGLTDDLFDLHPLTRLVVQAAAAILMVTLADIRIWQIGDLFGSGQVPIPLFLSLVFTVVCAIGVMNSINMIDGVDGLAGTLLLISLLALGIIAWNGGEIKDLKVLVILMGSILGFLCFNARIFVRSAKIFMGDAGSLFLGFVFCWYLIKLSQGEQAPLSAVGAGWLFGLPLLDTVSVIVRRLGAGISPFAAGRDHIHHRLLDAGMGVRTTVLVLALVHAIFVAGGLMLSMGWLAELPMFWGFVLLTIVHYFVTPTLVLELSKWLQGTVSSS